MKTMYINQLSITTQQSIESDLRKVLSNNEDIENALNSRLCDLSDTINIDKYL